MPHDDGAEPRDTSADRRRFLKAVGALGVVGLAGCGGDGGTPTETATDTPDMETTTAPDTETPIDTETPTPTETETPTPTETPSEKIPDPPAELLSFGEDSRRASAGETLTVEGELVNPYLFDVVDVGVSLAGPSDDWGIEATGDTSFDTLEPQENESVGWEVTVPESAEGDQTLTATVEYASATDEASTEVTTDVSVVPPAPDVTAPITEGLAGQMDAAQLAETDGLGLWQAVNADGRTGVLTQPEEGAQPIVAADASPTGESVARFEGDSDFMSTDEPLTEATAGVTISVVFRIDDESPTRQVIAYNGNDDIDNGYGLIIDSETRENTDEGHLDLLYGGVNWWYSDTTIQDDEFHLATMIIPEDAPDSPRLLFDGEEITGQFDVPVGPDPPGAPSTQYGIGEDMSTQGVTTFLDGDVGEQLVFERELPEEERTEIEEYLTAKWIGGGE
jgi:hypothetical protein